MQAKQLPDKNLVLAIFILLLFGWIMSFSSTVFFLDSYAYFIRHTVFAVVAIILGALMLIVPISFLKEHSKLIFCCSIIILFFTFIPNIGHEVNGSSRWIKIYKFTFQPSELMKLSMIIFMSGFLVRQEEDIRRPLIGFIKTIIIIIFGCFLIFFEPDYGATIIISLSAFAMLFVAGSYIKQLVIFIISLLFILFIFIIFNENRWLRITSFWQGSLWDNTTGAVFQTKQALIGIARGEWFGTGLGSGVQKYSLLPERHTDMIFATIGEELGIVGMLFVILFLFYIIIKGFIISQTALKKGRKYSSYLAFGICSWLAMQTIINIGMNIALFPPKGFTLPLLSYGGSSLILTVISLAIILRIDIENKAKYLKQKQYV